MISHLHSESRYFVSLSSDKPPTLRIKGKNVLQGSNLELTVLEILEIMESCYAGKNVSYANTLNKKAGIV